MVYYGPWVEIPDYWSAGGTGGVANRVLNWNYPNDEPNFNEDTSAWLPYDDATWMAEFQHALDVGNKTSVASWSLVGDGERSSAVMDLSFAGQTNQSNCFYRAQSHESAWGWSDDGGTGWQSLIPTPWPDDAIGWQSEGQFGSYAGQASLQIEYDIAPGSSMPNTGADVTFSLRVPSAYGYADIPTTSFSGTPSRGPSYDPAGSVVWSGSSQTETGFIGEFLDVSPWVNSVIGADPTTGETTTSAVLVLQTAGVINSSQRLNAIGRAMTEVKFRLMTASFLFHSPRIRWEYPGEPKIAPGDVTTRSRFSRVR